MILFVIVRPNSRISRIVRIETDNVHIDIQAPADKDKANKELIHFLSKCLRLPRNNIQIISGQKQRNKKVLLETKRDDVFQILQLLTM